MPDTMMGDLEIDPVLVSIIPNRLDSIAEEMAQTLMMTSRSGIFAEARDFVTGIMDANGRLLAQSRYFPGFACALPYIVPPIIEKYHGNLMDGDTIIVNHPNKGNSHLPDMNVVKPVFWEDKIHFWVACKGHMADIGGAGVAGYDPNGETIWDEGVVVPPTKLYKQGVLQEEILDLLKDGNRNNRFKELNEEIDNTIKNYDYAQKILEIYKKQYVISQSGKKYYQLQMN